MTVDEANAIFRGKYRSIADIVREPLPAHDGPDDEPFDEEPNALAAIDAIAAMGEMG